MSGRVRAWAPALLWAAVLFSFSSRSTLPADLGGGMDKVAHFGAFAVLGLLLAHGARTERWPMGWAIVIGLLYAATDELHQAYVPGRSPDAADWVADALGVVVGYLISFLRSGRRGDRSAADDVSADSVRT